MTKRNSSEIEQVDTAADIEDVDSESEFDEDPSPGDFYNGLPADVKYDYTLRYATNIIIEQNAEAIKIDMLPIKSTDRVSKKYKLYADPSAIGLVNLPSPAELKGKILIVTTKVAEWICDNNMKTMLECLHVVTVCKKGEDNDDGYYKKDGEYHECKGFYVW